MPQTITIMTTSGPITIEPDQFVGFRPCTVTDPRTGQTVAGAELVITAGAIPASVPDAMRAMAAKLEEARRPSLIIPIVGKPTPN